MERELVCEIYSNIDDMTGEDVRYLLQLLLGGGALDAWAETVLKSGHSPAFRLGMYCRKEDTTQICELLLKNSTATGLTMQVKHRISLPKEVLYIETTFGMVRVINTAGKRRIMQDDLERLARKHKKSIAEMKKLLLEEIEE